MQRSTLGAVTATAQIAAAAVVAAVLALAAGPAAGQAEADDFSYADADARAACDSRILPQQGFSIASRVPGTRNDCFWVRNAPAAPAAVDQAPLRPGAPLPASAQGANSLPAALDLARATYNTTLRAIAERRALGWTQFLGRLATCGTDFTCHTAAAEARAANDRRLDIETALAADQFNQDERQIRSHFLRPGEDPGVIARGTATTARPQPPPRGSLLNRGQ